MTPGLDALMARLAWHRRALAEVAADFGLPAPSGLERPMADLDALRARRAALKAEIRGHLARGTRPDAGTFVEWLQINRAVGRWARANMGASVDEKPRKKCGDCRQFKAGVRYSEHDRAMLCDDCWVSRPPDRKSGFDRGECRGK
jgi:hypothetical protein